MKTLLIALTLLFASAANASDDVLELTGPAYMVNQNAAQTKALDANGNTLLRIGFFTNSETQANRTEREIMTNIDLWIRSANIAFTDSNIPVRLDAAFVEPLPAEVVNQDTAFDIAIAVWRQRVFLADNYMVPRGVDALYGLVTSQVDFCGAAAATFDPRRPDSVFAFGGLLVSDSSQTCYSTKSSLLAHELGHSLGARHAPGDNTTYIDGVGWQCGGFETVMTVVHQYPRTLLYSNLDVSINGDLCGSEGVANNQRVFKETAPLVDRVIPDINLAQVDFASSTDFSVVEGDQLTVTLTRSDSLGAATVYVVSRDDTATGGQDFEEQTTAVAFADGQLSADFVVPIIDDAGQEPAESFILSLFMADGAAVANYTSERIVTIAANDSPPPPPPPPSSSGGGSLDLLFVFLLFIFLSRKKKRLKL